MDALDNTDRKLLAVLDLNARQTNSQLARQLHLSKEVVGYRLRKLEERGFIKGYYTVLNPSLLGITYYRILIKFHSLDPKTEKEILGMLVGHPHVGWVATCFGKYDLIGVIEVQDSYQFDQFLSDFLGRYGSLIVEKEITIFASSYSFNKKFLTVSFHPQRLEYIHQPRRLPVDETDLKIIQTLSSNARLRLVALAQLLRLTPRSIAQRIQKLQKTGILQGFRVSVDFSKLGYIYTHTLIRLDDVAARNRIMDFFEQHQSTLYGAFQIGAYDISIEAVVKDLAGLQSFLQEMRNLFSKEIKTYDALIITREYKLTYYPFGAFARSKSK